MYVIKVDGELMYSPEYGDEYKVLSPRLHLEVNTAGSLEFTLPPCNRMYDKIHKMKSIVMVEQDGEVIFRGRVTEESIDTNRQKEIYCEGDLHFLLDSIQKPISQNTSPWMMFWLLIMEHTQQMNNSDKGFTIGDVSGLPTDKTVLFQTDTYADTFSTIQTLLLDVYGGYIRTKYADGSCNIEYISDYGHETEQKIKFGLNLLNVDSRIDAKEICTVLVPLGANTEAGTPLTVADANNGSIYVENTALIEKYGRIYRTYTWDEVTDPAQLLTLGQKYMQEIALSETLTLRAVDMHLIDGDIEQIRLGDKVNIEAPSHGLDRLSMCTAMDIDLEYGDQNEYTFGMPKQTMADQTATTVSQMNSMRNSINDQHRWLTETDTALKIAVEGVTLIGHETTQLRIDVDAAQEAITLKASQESVDVLGARVTGAETRIDAAEAAIELKANQTELTDLGTRLSGAEVRIDGAEAAIELKAGQATVDELGERVSNAEVRIDGMNSTITAKADRIELQGYVKMDDFEAVEGWTDVFASERVETPWLEGGTVNADTVVAPNVDTDVLKVGEDAATWKGQTVLTNIGTINQSKRYLSLRTADGGTVTLDIVTDVSITPNSTYINYLGK